MSEFGDARALCGRVARPVATYTVSVPDRRALAVAFITVSLLLIPITLNKS